MTRPVPIGGKFAARTRRSVSFSIGKDPSARSETSQPQPESRTGRKAFAGIRRRDWPSTQRWKSANSSTGTPGSSLAPLHMRTRGS